MADSKGVKFNVDLTKFRGQAIKKAIDILNDKALDIQNVASGNISKNNTTDRGGLTQSITQDVVHNNLSRYEIAIGSNLPYAASIEFGLDIGHRPPYKPLVGWAKRKLGLKGKEAIGVAIAIAKTIEKKGTKAQPFLHPAYNQVTRGLEKEIKDAITK